MVEQVFQTGSIFTLIVVAGFLGFMHTIFGPDHYVPFVMMARAQNWTHGKTARITFLCAIGHVGSSLVIGLVLVGLGMAASAWTDSSWAVFHEWRGSLAAWLLMGFGAAYFVWGMVRAGRRRTHTHVHSHENGVMHSHSHDHAHADAHMHAHTSKERRFAPWILFTIFIFGPCESLVPLMLAAWAAAKAPGVFLVTAAFSLTTIATMLAAVGLLLAGVSLAPMGKMERFTHALAGLSLVACGGAIQFLGL